MNYQLKGTGASIIVHAIILALFVYASAIQPVKKKVISLDFSIVENIQPTVSKGKNKVAEVKKVKAVKPKPKPKPIEKKKIVKKVKKKPLIQKKKEVVIPKPEPVVEEVIAEPIEEEIEEKTVEEEVIEAETDEESVEEEVISASNNLDSNSLEDNSAAASRARYLKTHFMYIKEKIQKKIVYPRIARRRGLQGKTVISFVICADGSVRDLKVVESSGYAVLDKSAIKTVKMAAPFPKPPVSAELVIPITFRLS